MFMPHLPNIILRRYLQSHFLRFLLFLLLTTSEMSTRRQAVPSPHPPRPDSSRPRHQIAQKNKGHVPLPLQKKESAPFPQVQRAKNHPAKPPKGPHPAGPPQKAARGPPRPRAVDSGLFASTLPRWQTSRTWPVTFRVSYGTESQTSGFRFCSKVRGF